jgi:hypothetical protein
VALPLGGRVKLDPWDDSLALLKAQAVGAVTDREKMPFEVTPFMLYLTRVGSPGNANLLIGAPNPAAAANQEIGVPRQTAALAASH